nr:hypothetical protein [uncultured Desulfobacter sp.]
MEHRTKPVIYWVLQDNQTTSGLIDFFELIRTRVKKFLTLTFLVPETSTKTLKNAAKLEPVVFNVAYGKSQNSYEGYRIKKEQLGDHGFSDGLKFRQALLLDDLGGGNLLQTRLTLPNGKHIAGIIVQVPTPLGSSTQEEKIFYAWVHLAKKNNMPVIGYELLSLASRWTLAPSLMDGLITTQKASWDYLNSPDADLTTKIWRIPRFEGCFFSPATHPSWRATMGLRYQSHDIPQEKTILYIAHNVAMTYEYKNLLGLLTPMGKHLHLMFSYGKDQVRGAHTHQQTIETICRDELKYFSFSFHDMNRSAEVTMADALVCCADCYSAEVSSGIGVPTIIYDPMVPENTQGYKIWIQSPDGLIRQIRQIIDRHNEETELSRILIDITKKNLVPRTRKGDADG